MDGVLVEKTVGIYESYLTVLIAMFLGNHVQGKNLGIVLGADGAVRLMPGLVRIPDVSFVSWSRLPEKKVPRDPIADLAPDLAVEVISKSNTPQEMARKLREYFAVGVRQVWYVYPAAREVHVFHSPEKLVVLAEPQSLDGGDVLPGFRLDLKTLFAEPAK